MAEGGDRRDDLKGFPGQGSVSSRQDLLQWETTSVETCTVMRSLGYGPEIIQARREAYREQGRLGTERVKQVATWIVTGSKAEGLTSYLESDRNELFVLNSVICLEDGVNGSIFPTEITVLRSYSLMSYHGHCRLLLEIRGTTIHPTVKDSFCDDGYGRELLSSDLFVNNWSNRKNVDQNVRHDRAGPSIPSTWIGILDTDSVYALRYDCPNILSKWASRPRHWPPLAATGGRSASRITWSISYASWIQRQ